MWKKIAVAGVLVAGCESPAHTSPRPLLDASQPLDARALAAEQDATEGGPSADAEVARQAWLRSEVALGPDGRSAPLTFTLGPRPVFALRTRAVAGLCFQLEDVRADGVEWVPPATSADYGDYCTRCEQRVAVGSGYGLFVLPSAAAQPAYVQALQLRIALRDCQTLSPLSSKSAKPSSLMVESTTYEAPAPGTSLVLPITLALATQEAFTGGALLDETFAKMRALWRAAGIELTMREPVFLPRPDAPVVYSATDRGALSALAHAAKQAAGATPWFVLTPCLVRQDARGISQPLAYTAHLPGGLALDDDEPDGTFVAAERCGGLTPSARYLDSETLATVMAHELGHYLGLFHVQEADGREDSLADTYPGRPNLMQAMPSPSDTALSDSQIAIARRHPMFVQPLVQ